jgi:hypothetical protein
MRDVVRRLRDHGRYHVTLSNHERNCLLAYRAAARQVREASIIAEGHTIRISSTPGEPGFVDIFVHLLAEEPFRSLALAIRLAYAKGEPAYFYYICNVLRREADADIKARVDAVRGQFHAALRAPENQIVLGDGNNLAVFTAQQVFEHWLYGIAFHQDPKRQDSVRLLASHGVGFPWSFQATALQLAGRILDLDDVVADYLKEARLERL